MAKALTKEFLAQHSKEEFLEYYSTHSSDETIDHFQLRSYDIYSAIRKAYGITERPNFKTSEIRNEEKHSKRSPNGAPNKGKKAYTNGLSTIYLSSEEEIPDGFLPGNFLKGKNVFYDPESGKKIFSSSTVTGFVHGKGPIDYSAIEKRTAKRLENIQHYAEEHNLIPLLGCITHGKYPKCVTNKQFMDSISTIKYKGFKLISRDDLSKVIEYESSPVDRSERIKTFEREFCREHNCTLLNDIILKYGQLSCLRDIEKIIPEEYRNLRFIDNKYLPEIKRAYENNLHGTSIQEQNLIEYIRSIYSGPIIEHARILPSDCSNYSKEVDCYLPEKNLAIEYNGVYWHSDQCQIAKNYHEQKSKECEKLGIRLIHIYSDEWLEDTDKIKSLLSIAIDGVKSKIYARNCEIKKITNKEAKDFNDSNHLQNHRNAQVTYGLFYNNELVQLMSFSKSKYNRNLQSENSWEIIRGCPGSNNIVVGGVGKLFKNFIADYDPDEIFSYCDFNKFDGRSYEAIGMKFIGYTGPNKWWLYGNRRVNRSPSKYNEMKKSAQGVIWGAGSKKYLWRKNNENKKD